MTLKYRILFFLHVFVGIGALFGGAAGMLNPHQPLGIPAELLEGSPFNSYFIPSLILFVVIGIGHIFSAITARNRLKYQGYISSVFCWALMIWIIVQCIILRAVDVLHVIYFMIGLIGATIAMGILFEKNQFPASLIR